MVSQGEVWWAELGEPAGSEPGFRRPVLDERDGKLPRARTEAVLAGVDVVLGRRPA